MCSRKFTKLRPKLFRSFQKNAKIGLSGKIEIKLRCSKIPSLTQDITVRKEACQVIRKSPSGSVRNLRSEKLIERNKRNSMEFDSSSTESRSTKNELSQEERKGSLKLIRPVKSIDLTSRKSSQSQNLKAKIEISSANSFTSIPNPLGTPLKTNTQKPPLPKKQKKRSRISEFSFSKSHSFNSSTSKGRSKISINTLCLTPKTKHKLSLSPHRKILKRRSTCTKKLLQSL